MTRGREGTRDTTEKHFNTILRVLYLDGRSGKIHMSRHRGLCECSDTSVVVVGGGLAEVERLGCETG